MAADKAKDPSPRDNIRPKDYVETFKVFFALCLISPCENAAKASYDCLNRHDYDRDKCLDFFQAYRDCKKTWMDQKKEDRRAAYARR
ncbi:hypothetical protein NEOLEDRAFT_1059840 [Neolentinus lepideus HHB14362 ss-1]|uniref:CHCH domain-containing protein n=1 Tax=Neolentinus lepideus HHB14362 ss-1 TaxID=1314782 RepID=A0A165UAH4_9AGAM|nr:hypothetical protein NEOLEDRAFT_1059840 [Neolentinus lepideus HHB14362 ss-1]